MAIVLLSLLTSSFTAPVANVAPPTALRIANAPQLQLAPGAAKVATRVRVSHILVDSEEMANTVKQSIEDGMEFASVAESLSSCDSKGTGGDLGWISPGLMVPEFDAAAFTFTPGELATIKSDLGWHVLRVAEASYLEAEMAPAELKERLADATATPPTLQLVDLRDDEELERAPLLSGFRHLPYRQWQTWAVEAVEGTLEPPLDPACEIVFMDHRGGRGERIMQYLAQQGYSKARFVRGGINAYAEEADPSVPVYLESDGDCTTCHEH